MLVKTKFGTKDTEYRRYISHLSKPIEGEYCASFVQDHH